MNDEELGCSCPPPVCGVKTPLGDPNETCDTMPHTDVIRTKFLAAMKDENLPLEDRQAAERAFNQMYPDKKHLGEMKMEMSVGALAITEAGSVVLITDPNSQGDLQSNGVVPTFDGGVVLRSKIAAVGTYARIPYTQGKRVIGHISEALRLLEQAGADLTTVPERPLTSLNPMERIERLEKENAQLRANVAK